MIFAIQATREGSSQLDAGQTFSSLAIISLLTGPATSFLQSLPMVGMATGCLNRIQTFLLSASYEHRDGNPDELFVSKESNQQTVKGPSDSLVASDTSMKLQKLQKTPAKSPDIHAVTFKNVSLSPSPGSSTVLHDINIDIRGGSLTIIVGIVGSGKSTLLKAIIGELPCSAGSLTVDAGLKAYCAQTPWLPNSTVRQIVCGYEVNSLEDPEWYDTVLHACAFDEDVRLLPDQDDSVIGSRGVILSGGQKQRLVSNDRISVGIQLTSTGLSKGCIFSPQPYCLG